MKTKNLIDDLSKNLSATKVIPKTGIRTLQIMSGMLLGTALTFTLFSIRSDLHGVIRSTQFIFGALTLFLGWLASSYSLSLLQLPTIENKKYLLAALFSVSILALRYLIAGTFFGEAQSFRDGLSSSGMKCSLDILFLSVLPGIALFFLLRKGAPMRISFVGVNIGLCCAMVGAFALQFSCPSNLPVHLLVWHLLIPLVVLSSIGAWMGRMLLKW